MPSAVHISWKVAAEAVMVEIALPGLPFRPDSCSR